MSDEAFLKAVFGPPSSDEENEDEVEEKPKPQSRGVLDFALETGIIMDHNLIPLEDQVRKVSLIQAFNGRRDALDRHKQEKQAGYLYTKKDRIMMLLNGAEQALKDVTDLPSFDLTFFEVAKKHMRQSDCDDLIGIGRDLYIMAGMHVGLFRADEDHRSKKIDNFKMRNLHKEAEVFLLNEQQQDIDRRLTEKRKRDQDLDEMQRMEEEEEKRREKEELHEDMERKRERWRDRLYFDPMRFYELTFNGYTEKRAREICWKEAHEARLRDEVEVPIVSSPPRSEYDPNEFDFEPLNLHCDESDSDSDDEQPAADEDSSRPDAHNEDVMMEDVSQQPALKSPKREPIDQGDEEAEAVVQPRDDHRDKEPRRDNTEADAAPRRLDVRREWHRLKNQREAASAAQALYSSDDRIVHAEPHRDTTVPQHQYSQENPLEIQRDSRQVPMMPHFDQPPIMNQRDPHQGLIPPPYDVASWIHQTGQYHGAGVPPPPLHLPPPPFPPPFNPAAFVNPIDPRQGLYVPPPPPFDHPPPWLVQRDHYPPPVPPPQLNSTAFVNPRVYPHAAAAATSQQQYEHGYLDSQRDFLPGPTVPPSQQPNRYAHVNPEVFPHAAAAAQPRPVPPPPSVVQHSQQAPSAAQPPRDDHGQRRDRREDPRAANAQGDRRDGADKRAPAPAATVPQREKIDRRGRDAARESREAAKGTVTPSEPSDGGYRSADASRSREASPVHSVMSELDLRDRDEEMEDMDVEVLEMQETSCTAYVQYNPTDREILANYKKTLSVNEMHALIGQAVAREEHQLEVKKKRMRESNKKRLAAAANKKKEGEEVEVNLDPPYLEYYDFTMVKYPATESPPPPPQIEVDLGEVMPTKSILKKREKNEPALLSDLRADYLVPDCNVEGDEAEVQQLQQSLLALQRSFKLNPRKKVTFRDAFDPEHTMRVYFLQATQTHVKQDDIKVTFDASDDGIDRYHLDDQIEMLHAVNNLMTVGGSNQMLGYYATLACRGITASCTSARKDEGYIDMLMSSNRHFTTGTTVPLNQSNDVIYTLGTAGMRNGAVKEYKVPHREYKIVLAMKTMPDTAIMELWHARAKMMITHAFDFILNMKMRKTPSGQAGFSHLVFSDSLLDRVNTYRFPSAYFLCHQHPLTLSSSFQLLCNEISGFKLTNIEWFLFAYGFDEIVFQGKDPEEVALSVLQHAYCTMTLVVTMHTIFSKTNPITVQPKFRVFKLPKSDADPEIQGWIEEFNSTLCSMHRPSSDVDFEIMDWENAKIIGSIQASNKDKAKKRKPVDMVEMANCITSFAVAANMQCGMRTSRVARKDDFEDFLELRRNAKVPGLSEEEFDRIY